MGYKFRSHDIEDKIKYAKPNTFFETVRQKFQKTRKNYRNLEETNVSIKDFDLSKKIVQESYGDRLGFMSKIAKKFGTAAKAEKRKKALITESYNINVFTEKAKKDMVYFKALFENTFNDLSEEFQELKNEIINIFESVLKDTIELYQETNTKPRYLTPNLAKIDISESEIIDIYNRHFKYFLQENYLKPLFNQELNEAEDIKKFAKFLAENGYKVNMEDVITYLGFEKSLKQFLESVLIPETSKKKIELFMESQDSMYYEIFDKNAKVLQESIESGIAKIASMLAPFLFNKVVDADMETNPVNFAGISIICKKVNDGPMICKVKKGDEINTDIDDIPEDLDDALGCDIDNSEEDLPLDDEDIEISEEDIDPEKLLKDELEAEEIDDVVNKEKKEEDDNNNVNEEDESEDNEDIKKDEDKKKEEKEIKESIELNESEKGDEIEPGNSKIEPYNTDKELDKIYNEEEVIPDEADEVKNLKDAAKEEK